MSEYQGPVRVEQAAGSHLQPSQETPWPSQGGLITPPTHLYSEETLQVDPIYLDPAYNTPFAAPTRPDPNFAAQANELVNASLGRTSDGSSVIDPNSVLGESGRLYHGYKEGKYFHPNDAAEQDRLDLQHYAIKIFFDGWLYLAPLQTVPRNVIDVATGTGIWAIEFAEKFPGSFVIGTDLSAIQPEPRVPNCVFQRDDAEDEWVFPAPHPPGSICTGPCEHRIMFDYVHLRLVSSSFNDTRVVIKNAWNNMKPGGWIEFQCATLEFFDANSDSEDTPLRRLSNGCVQGAANVGRDVATCKYYKQWLIDAGFVDVHERKLMAPMSPWPKDPKLKECGLYGLRNWLDGIRSMSWKLLRNAGYSAAEIETLVREVHDYLRDCNNRPHNYFWVVYGRKPSPPETT